jgi:hypothetical protein
MVLWIEVCIETEFGVNQIESNCWKKKGWHELMRGYYHGFIYRRKYVDICGF